MKFNIAFMGPEFIFNLRRDFILTIKYSLEDLGHKVTLSTFYLDPESINLVIGAYFLDDKQRSELRGLGYKIGYINTEIIANDMLNFNPNKVNFMGSYLPTMKSGEFIWDVVLDNINEYVSYGVDAQFLRWGSQQKLRDINHRLDKDLDFYFFGSLSPRRLAIIEELLKSGLKGMADNTCPYFVRNDRISRAKIHLNLIQDTKYSHVNAFRICYLAENTCCILSEFNNDPANYLKYTSAIQTERLSEQIRELIANNGWKNQAEIANAEFTKIKMKNIMEEILDISLNN